MEIPKDKILINPQEVMALTGLEYDCACKIIRELNEELRAKGYRTIRGKILKDYLFEISKEKGIENIYYIYCEYSYIMEVIRYGIINIDIVNKKVTVNIEKEEKYIEIFEKIARKSYPKLLENYEKYIDDELEDDEVEEYEDKMDEIMRKYSLKEFEKFLDKIKLK